MPDPADRIRAEPRTRAEPRSRAKPAPKRAWLRALVPKSKRNVAGAALGAMMIGIVVNAVALQHGRRIEPAPQVAEATVAAKPPAPAPQPAAAPEPPRPTPSPTTVAAAHPARSSDAIGDFLRNQGGDKRHLTLAAQAALAKLGFAVKPTGAVDAATREALAEYQKANHLPVSPEITAKLVKTLNAAVAAN